MTLALRPLPPRRTRAGISELQVGGGTACGVAGAPELVAPMLRAALTFHPSGPLPLG